MCECQVDDDVAHGQPAQRETVSGPDFDFRRLSQDRHPGILASVQTLPRPQLETAAMDRTPQTRAQAFEASEDVGRNATDNPTIGDVIAARFNRRDLHKGVLGVAASATVSPLAIAAADRAQAQANGRFPFKEVAASVDEKHHLAEGYDSDILIRWGDPVLPGAPAFDPLKQRD
jgi:hypothetical protein